MSSESSSFPIISSSLSIQSSSLPHINQFDHNSDHPLLDPFTGRPTIHPSKIVRQPLEFQTLHHTAFLNYHAHNNTTTKRSSSSSPLQHQHQQQPQQYVNCMKITTRIYYPMKHEIMTVPNVLIRMIPLRQERESQSKSHPTAHVADHDGDDDVMYDDDTSSS
jgi:hypothetical protein